MNAKTDGSVEIRKESDAGVLLFHCGGNEVEIIPEKSYELTAQFQGSGESLQAYFMLSFPGPKPRTPFPVSESQKVTGEAQTLKFHFTALEAETQLRVHFCLKGQGELSLSGLSMQEYIPAANLLEQAETHLVLRQNLGGIGTLQKSGPIDYEVSMSNDSGYVAVSPAAYETPVLKKYGQEFPQALVARDQLPVSVAEYSTHENQRVTKVLNDAIQAALNGTKTAAQAMDDAQKESERILRRYQ